VVLARFLPRDEQFFTHFSEAAANAAEAAEVLRDVVQGGPDLERKVRRLEDLETQGDQITHRVFSALNSTFVTPIDRDDIHSLATEIDDFVDDMEEVGERLGLYKVGEPSETALKLAQILVEQAGHLAHAMPLLEAMNKQREGLRRDILELHRLENEADTIHSEALARLYDGVTEVPSLITAMRWGEIHALLEQSTDRAETIANTLEGMLLKYA
jgi:predicted phosphate transport protein (TIGR00153 family)